MTDVVTGFVLALAFLVSLASGIVGYLAYRETKRNRAALAQGLRLMADLAEQQARAVRLDPAMTGAGGLRMLAEQAEAGATPRRKPRERDAKPPVRMRPLEDHEEWALEQERKGWQGLDGGDLLKAQKWAREARDTRIEKAEA